MSGFAAPEWQVFENRSLARAACGPISAFKYYRDKLMTDSAVRLEHEPPKGKLKNLNTLWSFVRPYKLQLVLAAFFLLVAATTVLIVPTALGDIVDKGFSADNAQKVNDYFLVFVAIVAVMAIATAFRFYFVTWLGERVVAPGGAPGVVQDREDQFVGLDGLLGRGQQRPVAAQHGPMGPQRHHDPAAVPPAIGPFGQRPLPGVPAEKRIEAKLPQRRGPGRRPASCRLCLRRRTPYGDPGSAGRL